MAGIVAIDFDGPINRYSGWKGPTHVVGPTAGAMAALKDYVDAGFEPHIISSRLRSAEGERTVRDAVARWLVDEHGEDEGLRILNNIVFDKRKPPALITIDDRAYLFVGHFPKVSYIKQFKPWCSEGELHSKGWREYVRKLLKSIFEDMKAVARKQRSDK